MAKILFLGTGNMGGAILQGLLRQDTLKVAEIGVFDPNSLAAAKFKDKNCKIFAEIEEALTWANTLIICVKPQIFNEISDKWNKILLKSSNNRTIISIMAGISIQNLKKSFPKAKVVVRTMPNLPMTIGKGVVSIAQDELDEEVLKDVQNIFAPVAKTVLMPENMMDAATALSGSGPAFVFQFIDAMIQGGIKEGLSKEIAEELCLATIAGSTALVVQSDASPADLSTAVSSPGGTTIYGLHALESGAFKATISKAISAAAERSRFLNK
ncbi:MAG: pyrroline-5-carboxylate reductase [Fibrobacter sp.]|nr:pyrroline-5-carboxylate reductase [Fibrobacter sp.]